ncbi:MAG: oligopeptide/dipeptide ABC transporter ATP-binding protein [Ramlibacter sp.]
MSAGASPLLSVRDLHVDFRVRGANALPWTPMRTLRAVDGVSLDLHAGETLGVVGESGCGKSTLARAILGLVPASAGSIRWFGEEMRGAPTAAWQKVRRQVQVVFQDPLASLDPRMNVAQIVAEPLRTHEPHLSRQDMHRRAKAMLERVGLAESQMSRYPHEFSGGQCQRIGIARALVLAPRVVVCDEPVSALDVTIQAQIVELLEALQREMRLALVFIAHDLAVVRRLSRRVQVMYLGKTMEAAPGDALYRTPRHPYTQALLAAVPVPDPRVERAKDVPLLAGEPPSPLAPPSGCVFRSRCPHAFARCVQAPPLKPAVDGSVVACWLA